MTLSGAPGVGKICTLSLCVLLLCSWTQCGPIPSPEDHNSIPLDAVESVLLKPNDNVDLQKIVGQFLHMINFTDPERERRPRNLRAEPPDYMLELYQRFTSNRSARPSANIVRSFKNEGHGTQRLMFNISVPQHERVVSAELRLYVRVTREPRRVSAGRRMRVFEMQRDERCRNAAHAGAGGAGGADPRGMREVASQHVVRQDSGWEVFDLTNTVQNWRRSGNLTPRLQVHIETVDRGNEAAPLNEWSGRRFVDLDIDRNPDGNHEPALIIFSDDQGEGPKLSHMTKEENRLPDPNGWWTNENEEEEEEQDEALMMQTRSTGGPRVRRAAKVEDCKRTEMYVDFKDIGWDSWVVAPSGYQAYACRGACSYPLAPDVTPTKHAIIQTLLNLKSPQKASKACCVPTKLDPISLLYENKNGVVVLKHKYEGMVVAECGCR